MKFLFLLLNIHFILTVNSFAEVDDEESTPEFPDCMVDRVSGNLSPSFFNDFSRVSVKLGVCDASMDPRMKAFLHIKQLVEFNEKLPAIISSEVDFYTDSLLKYKDASSIKVQLKAPRNLDKILMKSISKNLDTISGISNKNKNSKHSFENEFSGNTSSIKSEPEVLVSLDDQVNHIKTFKNELITEITSFNNKLKHILEAIEKPEGNSAKNLSLPEKEYLRSMICRFMPAMTSPDDPMDKKEYRVFCSKEGGQEDLNMQRGMLFCSDIEQVKDKKKNLEAEKIRSSLSRTMTDNIKIPDPYELETNGTLGRLEIVVSDFQNDDQPKSISLSFRSPGGIPALCNMLKSPEYNKYWRYRAGRKTLNPVMPIVALKIPMVVAWQNGNGNFPNREVFSVDKEGNIQAFKRGGRKVNNAQEGYYQKYLLEKKTEAQFQSVRNLVGDQCDE